MMEKSEIGEIVTNCWHEIDIIYENIKTDAFCIMPNHIHGIIIIGNEPTTGGQSRPPLQRIVQGFKSVTTRLCFNMGFQKIWQRSYHDRIIRNETDYQRIWQYIDENPAKWTEDEYYFSNQ